MRHHMFNLRLCISRINKKHLSVYCMVTNGVNYIHSGSDDSYPFISIILDLVCSSEIEKTRLMPLASPPHHSYPYSDLSTYENKRNQVGSHN